MATIGQIGVAITAETTGLTRGLAIARAKIGAFANSMSSTIKSGVSSAAASLASIGVASTAAFGAAIAAGAGWGVKLAADAEAAEVSFTTMLGSLGKAQTLLGDIRKFAAATPFEFPELREASQKLLAFNTPASEIVGTLTRIGDISAGIGAPIGEIAELYGKARVQGRLFMEDINQLTGRGIPIIQQLAKQFGVTDGEVRKLVEDGKINFGNLEKAFVSLTSTGGQFAGMMAAQSQTLSGIFSSLKDEVSSAVMEVGKVIIEEFDLKGAASNAIVFVGSIKESFMSTLPLIRQGISTVKAGFGVVGDLLGQVGSYWSETFSGMGLTWQGFWDGLRDGLILVEFGFTNWRKVLQLAFDQVQLGALTLVNDITFFFTEQVPSVLTAFGNTWITIIKNVFNQTISNWSEMIAAISEMRMPQFDWSPLTAGLVEEFAKIKFDRKDSPLEKSLKAGIASQQAGLTNGLADFYKKKRAEFDLKKEAADRVDLGNVAKSPTVSGVFGSLQKQFGVLGGLASQIKPAKLPEAETGPTGAIRRGSAEAFSAIQASNRNKKSPEQEAVAELKMIGKGISNLVAMGKQKATDAFQVVESFL